MLGADYSSRFYERAALGSLLVAGAGLVSYLALPNVVSVAATWIGVSFAVSFLIGVDWSGIRKASEPAPSSAAAPAALHQRSRWEGSAAGEAPHPDAAASPWSREATALRSIESPPARVGVVAEEVAPARGEGAAAPALPPRPSPAVAAALTASTDKAAEVKARGIREIVELLGPQQATAWEQKALVERLFTLFGAWDASVARFAMEAVAAAGDRLDRPVAAAMVGRLSTIGANPDLPHANEALRALKQLEERCGARRPQRSLLWPDGRDS